MEISQELDDFIKQSIDHTLNLPVPVNSLQLKLQSLEAANYHLRDQYLTLQARLKQKDETLERARAEASMNAQAIKRFVEENQKLASACEGLVSQCSKLEREISLYDRDREVLMEFGNEVDKRAKEAEARVHDLEDELRRVTEEAQSYKFEFETHSVDSNEEAPSLEQNLLNGLVASLVNKDEVARAAHGFLEANRGSETCDGLLRMWNNLRPSTQNVLGLAAQVQILQKDKENLRTNLNRAEEEVRVLFEENKVLDEENKKLWRICNLDWNHGSAGKHSSSTTAKRNKRKTSPGMSSPSAAEKKKLDFTETESPRQPLSPLKENSPDSRIHKK